VSLEELELSNAGLSKDETKRLKHSLAAPPVAKRRELPEMNVASDSGYAWAIA
jgi:hypothetical protein